MHKVAFTNESKFGVILDLYKYQKRSVNKNGSVYYICSNSGCSVSLTVKDDKLIRPPTREHNHHKLSRCELDIEIIIDDLKRIASTDLFVDLRERYEMAFEKLKLKYSYFELMHYWKPWSLKKRTFRSFRLENFHRMNLERRVKTEPPEYTNIGILRPKPIGVFTNLFDDVIFIDPKSNEQPKPDLTIEKDKDLDSKHIEFVQKLIAEKYKINGLIGPDLFKEPDYSEYQETSKQKIIQIVYAEDHWITISNFNPFFGENSVELGLWFIFDSLNKFSMDSIRKTIKYYNPHSNQVKIIKSKVCEQRGSIDSGIFSIGYAIALAEGKNPSRLIFQQLYIRSELNMMIQSKLISELGRYEANVSFEMCAELIDFNI